MFSLLAAVAAPVLLVGSFTAPAELSAQPAASGVIEGRVLNLVSGAYLENVRVVVDGTALQAFTNNFGEYRLIGVPAGTATVRISFTGQPPQTATVAVSAGQTVTKDFTFGAMAAAGKDEAVQLDAFVVAAVKETNANAIAINEQRYAANIKNVVAADEFGTVTEGNVGEFLKFLPGVTLDYTAADARSVSIRGIPSSGTGVTIDGFSVANTGAGVANRTFEFDQLSINNVSRIEVTKGPTPESPASAIGGTVNLVSKSAFERSRAEFTYRAYVSMNHQTQQDIQFMSFTKTPGPGRESSGKVKPGFDFTYVKPVSKNFGFTLTGLNSNIFNQQYSSQPHWTPTSNTGTAGAATLANPAMTSYQFNEGPKSTSRYSLGATIDWRPAPYDVVSVGGSWNAFDAFFNNHTNALVTGAPTAFDRTFTQGGNTGTSTLQTSTRRAARATYVINAKYRHNGPVWKSEAGASLSHSKGLFRDMDYGWAQATRFALTNVRLLFSGNNPDRPDNISGTTATGAPLDIRNLGNYTFTLINTNPVDSLNTNKTANANLSRYFDVGVPVLFKVGADVRRVIAEARRPFRQWTFVGPDHVANNADNLASNYDLVDTNNSSVPAPYGNGNWQYGSPWKAYDLYKAHPDYFVHDDVYEIQQNTLNSNIITEDVIAQYLRMDVRLFKNRLWIVAGARYERTRDNGYGPVNDISRTYQRNAAGQLIDGNPNVAGIQPVKIVGTAVDLARLQYVERGTHVSKDYGDLYPSLNLTYNLLPNLIARGSYANTLSRPNYTNIIPGTTLPDPAGTSKAITLNNIDLKPWTAKNYDVAVSYYPDTGGEVTAGVFRKDIKDFFGSRSVDATAALVEQYGIDSSYGDSGYTITTLQNAGSARISGWEFNYRQPLKFLPNWARGVNIRYNITQLHLEGNTLSDFSAFIRRSENYGISLDRPKYSLRLNWNSRGRQRQGLVGGAAEPSTYTYVAPRLTMDIDGEYRFSKSLGFFLGARNITGVPFIIERYGPNTPAYARRYQRDDYGIAISAGVKGSF
ncbi:MAG: TonB-dependent receptor [Verrucomicrobia bacterium]|nr:TonB-dependent receptor [Verrucomicrobiota bacterium]